MQNDNVNGAERFQVRSVLTLIGAHAVHHTYIAFLAPLLPALITNLSLSKTKAGLLMVFIQGPSVVQPLVGHLADRVSLRYFVILAPAISALMMSALGLAPSYATLALLLTVVGVNSAVFHAVAPVMVGSLSGQNLGRGLGFWTFGGELGQALGPIVIVSAITLLSPNVLPSLMIGGVVASAILYMRLKDVPEQSSGTDQGISLRQGLQSMRPLLIPLVGIIGVESTITSMLTTYLPTFLSEEGAHLWFAGVSLSVFQAAGVVGGLLGGSISDRLGRRPVLFIYMLTMPLFILIFLAVSRWVQFAVLLLLGFTGISSIPVIQALMQESFPKSRALANGIYMALSFGLRSVAIVSLGALADLFGLRPVFTASAIIPLLGLPLVLMLPRTRPQHSPE